MIRMLLFVVSLVVVGVCSPSSLTAAKSKPNIVLILADDMGYGDIRAYNHESQIPTPNLDDLANRGMSFSDAHSPSAVCTPTRYGVLTGRYCWRTKLKKGVLGGYSLPLLRPDRPTIAGRLAKAGYHTGAIGKWHLGMALPRLKEDANLTQWDGDPGIDFGGIISDSPIHHGFDYYFGVSASLDMAPFVYIRNDRFTALPKHQQPAVKFPHFVRKGPRADDFIIDQVLDKITGEAVSFISSSAQKDKPFFLYLPLTAPHKPTQPHARFRGKTELNDYGDFVAQVDWSVGQIIKAIDEAEIDDNTLIVYTSDNGSYMRKYEENVAADHVTDVRIQGFKGSNHLANGPLRGTKADVWEAGHRVPFIARWTDRISAGSKCEQTICLTDLYATFAEIVGISLTNVEAEDSVSMLANLRGHQVARSAPVINHSAGGMFAIRDGDWKLVLGNGSGGRQKPKGKPFTKPYELYNLADDIAETHNLASQNPEIVERLTERLNAIRDAGRSVSR